MSKKILILWVLTLLLLMPCNGFTDDSAFRPRLGCVPFMATTLQAMAFTEEISSTLLSSIDRGRYFEIVERKKIEQFLELEGLRLDNLDNEGILRISGKAGLDYVVHGSVNANEAGTSLNINLINIRTRKVIMKESFSMSQMDSSKKLMEIAGILIERVKTGVNLPQTSVADVSLSVAPLKPPNSLEASGTANSIRLRWQSDMKQFTGFNVYRSASIGGQYTLQATTTETSFVDENMKLNEVFYYRVATVGQSGAVSELTPPVKGGTAVAPPTPIFMNVEPVIKGAMLVWRPRAGSSGDIRTEAKGYMVYRKQGAETSFALVARLPADAVSYSDNGLSEEIRYVYTVTSHNSEGTESEYSSKLGVTPLPVPTPVRVVSGKIRHVPVSWDRYPYAQGDGYLLSRSAKQDGQYAVIATLDGLDTTTYTDRGLADKTTYWYRISVFKKGGVETAPSKSASVTTRDIPTPPINLLAVGNQPRKVTLKWRLAGVPEDEIKSVIIYRTMDEKGGGLKKIAEVSASRNEFVDDEQALPDKTTFYYRLSSLNSGGAMSQQSGIVYAATKSPPATPTNLSATSGAVKKTDLLWDKNSETDIKEYRIFIKKPDDVDFKEIRAVAENSYQDSELKDGTEYRYKIRAVDRDGLESAFSKIVVVNTKPLPSKVAGFKAVDIVIRSVAWKPNQEKDVKNYNIYKKGFLGIAQKVATVQDTKWQVDDPKSNLELYVTAVDDSGLESEPSDIVVFKER